MSELNIPESWAEASYQSVVDVIYGKGLPERSRRAGPYPVLSSAGVVGSHDDYMIEGPIVVTGRKGTLGKPHYVSENSWVIDTAFGIKPSDGVNAKFVYWHLQSISLEDLQASTAIPSLSREALYATLLPIPPLDEQERIVRKIESCIERISQIEMNLNRISELSSRDTHESGFIKRFKESVLKKAFEGRLVQQDSSELTGHDLLNQILSRRELSGAKKDIASKKSKKIKGRNHGKK